MGEHDLDARPVVVVVAVAEGFGFGDAVHFHGSSRSDVGQRLASSLLC
jgi:hypothetical protein